MRSTSPTRWSRRSRRRSPRRRWSSSAAATDRCRPTSIISWAQDTVFALLPLGTANSFARTLGIPLDLDGAIDVIANGQRKRHRPWLHRRRLFRQCRGDRPVAADRRHGAAQAQALSRHGRLPPLGRLWCAFKFPPVPADDRRRTDGAASVWATEARIANGTHHGGVELVERPGARQRRDRHPGGHRQSVWGLALELVRDPVQARSRATSTTRELRGRKTAAGNAAAAEYLDRRRDCGEDAGDGQRCARRDRSARRGRPAA